MNKLEMAHDYLKVLLTQNTSRTVGEAVETAYALADAMQSEADKRLKTDVGNTDASEWQPDWSQAPDSAMYWAMDGCGQCNWYEREPEVCGSQWDFGSVIEQSDTGYDYQGNWQDSLRKRPQ